MFDIYAPSEPYSRKSPSNPFMFLIGNYWARDTGVNMVYVVEMVMEFTTELSVQK